MLNLYKFWTLSNAEGFTLADVPLALRDSIDYTFGDAVRIGDLRYKSGDAWIPGFDQPLVFTQATQNSQANEAYCLTVYDGENTKLGIIVMTNDGEYTRYHDMMERPGMRQAIAQAFGYNDSIVITGYSFASDWTLRAYISGNDRYRAAQAVPMYSPLYVSDVNWRAVEATDRPAAADFIGTALPSLDLTGRSPICTSFDAGKVLFVLPVEHYHTDLENVATLNTTCDALLGSRLATVADDVAAQIATVDGRVDTLTTAFGSIASLVGSLSVFGNTVKDVTERYNTVAQYIPRP